LRHAINGPIGLDKNVHKKNVDVGVDVDLDLEEGLAVKEIQCEILFAA